MKSEMMLIIFNKWYKEYKHGHFTYYKDGDLRNDNKNNLGYVDIREAFKKNLIFDWKFGLNKEEISYVTENWEFFRDY